MTERPKTYYTDQRPESVKTREILSRLERVSKYETQSLIKDLWTLSDSSLSMTGSDPLSSVLWYLTQLSDQLSRPETLSDSDRDFISETLQTFSEYLSKQRRSLEDPETLERLESLGQSLTRLSFSVLAIYTLYNLRETVSDITKDLERLESLIYLTVSLEEIKDSIPEDPETLEDPDQNGA